MNYLIKHSKKLLSLVLVLALITSCKDYQDLDVDPVDTGDADFSSYVAVGNSLTAGFQNNALYQSGQKYSFPKLLARQVNQSENFDQPLVSDPGISSGDGRIELANLDPIQTTANSSMGSPINQNAKPFTNLGVPGAVLVDYLNPNNSGDLKGRATNPDNPAYNPFYGLVMEQSELAKNAPNLHNQVAKQQPTFITFWLGNNDVLGFVTSGGEGQSITNPNNFSQLYQGSVQAMASTSANVVVYTIPDVTTIPYVFYLRTQLEQQGAIVFNDETQRYQLVTEQGNLDIYIETDDGTRVMRQADFPLLSAQSYFAQVRDGETQPPVQPQTAVPDNLVLDGPAGGPQGSSEIEQAAGAIQQYNATIENSAASAGFTVVDINQIFAETFNSFQSY
ncbi:SGNH/GDSL hydrolase family protein [Fodinibius sp.]|uniref:SGNH/GDSL hydrolase family protein n=1 Tax=Fodinibius sp. TaxID=1872440 RepID=UPI002ACD4DC0|nr:SGNH/GDSL hydrolase family protein [Fodinibius sp.]MDZ7658580.1 SGNH/GDSL hydrolase family protein [Fodinibius sp.]